MRQVHINENLDGQTLEGPALQSYFYNCSLSGTTFIGDWQGSDFINCTGDSPDWTGADVYAGYWRGTNFTDAKYPSNIGYYHHEPVADILDNYIKDNNLYDAGFQYTMIKSIADEVRVNYNAGSWIPSYLMLRDDGLVDNTENENYFVSVFTDVFSGFDELSDRFKMLKKFTLDGNLRSFTPEINQTIVKWPMEDNDILIDGDNLPEGINNGDRYSFAKWIEHQADLANPDINHHCLLLTIIPMRIWLMPTADYWLINKRSGY